MRKLRSNVTKDFRGSVSSCPSLLPSTFHYRSMFYLFHLPNIEIAIQSFVFPTLHLPKEKTDVYVRHIYYICAYRIYIYINIYRYVCMYTHTRVVYNSSKLMNILFLWLSYEPFPLMTIYLYRKKVIFTNLANF